MNQSTILLPADEYISGKEKANGNISERDNPYEIMKALANFTKKHLVAHDLQAVVKCLGIADKIYSKGTSIIKDAVENMYVFSFSSFKAACNRMEWKVIENKMPATLYSLYVKQIYQSGI